MEFLKARSANVLRGPRPMIFRVSKEESVLFAIAPRDPVTTRNIARFQIQLYCYLWKQLCIFGDLAVVSFLKVPSVLADRHVDYLYPSLVYHYQVRFEGT